MSETAITTLADDRILGEIFVKSGFFKDTESEAQAIVKILAGRELGIGPIESMTGIHIIQKKVSVGAHLMAAAIKRSEKYTYVIKTHTDEECTIEFFENGESIGTSTFTIEEAKKAGVMSVNERNWKKWPKDMLFARAISRGMRHHCPDVFSAPVYVPEELGAKVNDDGEPVNITASASVVVPSDTTSSPDYVMDIKTELEESGIPTEDTVGEEKPAKKYKTNRVQKDKSEESKPLKEAELIYKGEVVKAVNVPKTTFEKRMLLVAIANNRKHELSEKLLGMIDGKLDDKDMVPDDDVELVWTMLIEQNPDVDLKKVG